jgi:hypothetical protein
MSTCLLDTNISFDLLNDKKGLRALLLELLNQGHVLACCRIRNEIRIFAVTCGALEFLDSTDGL